MLTWPLIAAVASAGVIGGVHCAGMCGGVATMLSTADRPPRKIILIVSADAADTAGRRWPVPFMLHAGRLSAYGLMGAVVGAFGALGLLLKPIMPVHAILFIIGNLALIWLGLRLAGHTPDLGAVGQRMAARLHWLPRFSLRMRAKRHPFLAGMAWACLPCGVLYGVLPFALLSGDPWSGALLMLVFGLTALPHLLAAQGAAQWLRGHRVPGFFKGLGAAGLIGFGLFGLWHFNAGAASPWLCLTPLH